MPALQLDLTWSGPGGARIPKAVLLARFQAFSRGDWASLLQDAFSQPSPEAAAGHRVATSGDARARRAVHLAHLGELSAARQALTADPLAPSTDATFEQLSDPGRRPPEPYGPLAPDLLDWEPPSPVAVDSRCSPIYAGPGKGLLPGLLGSLPKLHVLSWMMRSLRRRSLMSRPCLRKRKSLLPSCPRLDLAGLLPLLSRAGVPVGWSLATSLGALSRAHSRSNSLAPSRRLVHTSMPLAIVLAWMP